MNIVLAIDGSPCSKAAVEELAMQKLDRGSSILVVTVIDTTRKAPVEIEEKIDRWAEAEKLVAAEAMILKDIHPEATITTQVLEGPVKQCLIDFVDEADLLVVGSHGRQGISRFLLGSVSQTLLHYVSCSMRIVKGEGSKKNENRVLVALDNSAHSRSALEKVLYTSWPENSRFRIVTVVEGVPRTLWFSFATTEEKSIVKSVHEAQRQAQEKFLDGIRPQVKEKLGEERVTMDILQGDPREKILELAEQWDANLIVMGSHGVGYHDRFELGSVSETVAMHSPCSVQVVKPVGAKIL